MRLTVYTAGFMSLQPGNYFRSKKVYILII